MFTFVHLNSESYPNVKEPYDTILYIAKPIQTNPKTNQNTIIQIESTRTHFGLSGLIKIFICANIHIKIKNPNYFPEKPLTDFGFNKLLPVSTHLRASSDMSLAVFAPNSAQARLRIL